MARRRRRATDSIQYGFGIGEWYGRLFTSLTDEERKEYARIQTLKASEKPAIACPFRSSEHENVECRKKGGVCSLRLYQLDTKTQQVTVHPTEGSIRATCPFRFDESDEIYDWVAETILCSKEYRVLKEIPFLERIAPEGEVPVEEGEEGVGRIDKVLVLPNDHLEWCALEVQAVYFSGREMSADFRAVTAYEGNGIPFPGGKRHPDYRSSGPKRLMPQLQIKVPSLRRWGKKMAVVIDEAFFNAMGPMDSVRDVSNCDIAWFIVRFEISETGASLVPLKSLFTTLERSVEGLTAGVPVSLQTFEERIRAKL